MRRLASVCNLVTQFIGPMRVACNAHTLPDGVAGLDMNFPSFDAG